MREPALLSITEVGERTGLQSSALRYYEREGLIQSAGRSGGRRLYNEGVLQRLAVVSLLQEVGFTIGEIAELMNPQAQNGWRSLAEDKLHEIDAHMKRVQTGRELLTAALACKCSSLDTCDIVAARRGPHRKVTQTLTLRMAPPSR